MLITSPPKFSSLRGVAQESKIKLLNPIENRRWFVGVWLGGWVDEMVGFVGGGRWEGQAASQQASQLASQQEFS